MEKIHQFLPNSHPSITKQMLLRVGAASADELFEDVPKNLLLDRPLNLPQARSEFEIERQVEELLSKNRVHPEYLCFLGGGVWPHHVPAAVDEITSRTEFYSSYTQYQPEISQGMLQALFEYQSLICELTGMDVANSSLYDWPTAAAEAARMAVRVKGRKTILVSRGAGPERLGVIRTYCQPLGINVRTFDFNHKSGQTIVKGLSDALRNDVAAVYVENPNFFGIIEEEVHRISELVHKAGALYIVGADPLSLGVLKPPGEYGADIVVGEGQPLGIHMNFGGPLLGIFATREDPQLLRQAPGRIIGMTTTKEGSKRGFCMVLQTREQHIRREGASSNICTNQALCALAAAVYLALLGPVGLREIGERILYNSHYVATLLGDIKGLKSPYFSGPFFKDFVVGISKQRLSPEQVHRGLYRRRILGAIPLPRHYPELKDAALFSATEVHQQADLERLAHEMKRIVIGK